VEPQHQLAIPIAERVLELVAVAPLLDGGLDRLKLVSVQLADAAQGVVDLVALGAQLALVVESLPGRPGTGLAGVLAAIGDAVGAGSQELHTLRLCELTLCLRHLRAHLVAG